MTMEKSGLKGLNSHDASKRHFASLKHDLISQNLGGFSLRCYNNNNIFFSFGTHFKSSSYTTSQELRHQFADCSG